MYSFYVPTLCHNKYHHNAIIIISSSSNIIIIIRIIIGLSNEKLNTSSYSVPIPSQLRQPSQPPARLSTIIIWPSAHPSRSLVILMLTANLFLHCRRGSSSNHETQVCKKDTLLLNQTLDNAFWWSNFILKYIRCYLFNLSGLMQNIIDASTSQDGTS